MMRRWVQTQYKIVEWDEEWPTYSNTNLYNQWLNIQIPRGGTNRPDLQSDRLYSIGPSAFVSWIVWLFRQPLSILIIDVHHDVVLKFALVMAKCKETSWWTEKWCRQKQSHVWRAVLLNKKTMLNIHNMMPLNFIISSVTQVTKKQLACASTAPKQSCSDFESF